MRISIRFNEDVSILSLSGKFLAGADGPFLRQKVNDLLDGGARKLLIDFASVPYIDSTGIGFLVGAREAAERAKVKLVLAAVNQHVMKILDEVKLSSFFVFASSENDAIAKLNQMAAEADAVGSVKRTRKRSSQSVDPSSGPSGQPTDTGESAAAEKKPG